MVLDIKNRNIKTTTEEAEAAERLLKRSMRTCESDDDESTFETSRIGSIPNSIVNSPADVTIDPVISPPPVIQETTPPPFNLEVQYTPNSIEFLRKDDDVPLSPPGLETREQLEATNIDLHEKLESLRATIPHQLLLESEIQSYGSQDPPTDIVGCFRTVCFLLNTVLVLHPQNTTQHNTTGV